MNTRALRGLTATLLCILAIPIAAQESGDTITTEHYSIRSDVSRDQARTVGRRLEAFLELYNRQFRFPLEELAEPLRVRLFDSRSRYDEYLGSRAGAASGEFVYLHYADPRRRELVGFTGEAISDHSLTHQSFVQYVRAFVPHPPLWIREGFAVYFSGTRYDEGFDRAVYEENLAWLGTLKDMVAGTSPRPWISWDDVIFMPVTDVQETAESFYPQAWGLVTFLLDSEDPGINRLIWDSIGALDPGLSLEENSRAVYRHAFRWEDREELRRQFREYVASRKTFTEWVSTGVERYEENDRDGAEQAMVEALQVRGDHHVPYYYLGLINYDRKNYETAAYYYREALHQTDSPGPVLYALGVNAIADDRPEDAREYLESVGANDAEGELRDEAEVLLRRLSTSTGG